jgi:tetratricopeptide (TPR) repeat protein
MRIEAALTLMLLVSTPGAAEPSVEERARSAAEAGKVAFDAGDFPAAITWYREALRLKPVPTLLFNLGQSYRRARDFTSALTSFRAYLLTGPSAAQVATTEALIRATEGAAALEAEATQQGGAGSTRLRPLNGPPEAGQRDFFGNGKTRAEAKNVSVLERWWFWAGVGVLVAGAVTATIVVASPRASSSSFQDINAR